MAKDNVQKVGQQAGQQQSGKPGTKDDKAKKEKKSKRVVHPSVVAKDHAKLTEVPKDFDFSKNRPLRRKDFADDGKFFLYKAAECDAKAADFRKKAEEAGKLGAGKEKGKAKRLLKMQEKMAELKKQLSEQGIDVEALLKDADGAESEKK